MKHIFHTIQHTARAATVLLLALLAAQTAGANDAVTYIGMDGKTKTVTEYTDVTTDMNLYWSSGTYVVKSSVTLNGCISFDYPAVIDLIVCDGATLTVNGNDDGAFDGTTLNIYAQSNGTGMGVVNVQKETSCIQLNIAGGKVTLDDDGAGYGLYVFDGDACGLTVNGGDVTIQNSNGSQGAIYFNGRGFVTLNGGKLTVTNSKGNGYTAIEGRGNNTINFNGGTAVINGKISNFKNINLNSGNVTVNGEIDNSYGYTVTYDFTHATDSYYINSFSNDLSSSATRTVQVKDGATFLCDGNKYIGPLTLTDDDISAISAQTMTPDISNHFSVNDAGTEYTIHTAKGWDLFCDMLEAGETFSGKTVELDGDIGTPEDPVTRMGSSTTQFRGTFDGAGHTLTVQYGTPSEPVNQQFVAPFVEVAGAAKFTDLTIAGSIHNGYATSGDKGTGGLIGCLRGGVTVEHCVSTVTVNAASDRAGGFVGLCEHAVTFTDCVSSATVTCTGSGSGFVGWSRDSKYTIAFYGCLFSGKVLKQGTVGSGNGSFVGWKGFSKTVTITNCIAAPAADENMATDNSATFCRYSADTTKDNGETHIANSYYTAAFGAAQGKQAHTVTAGTDVTVAHAGVATHYATSGITAYKATGASADIAPFIAGLLYNNNVVDVLYAGSDDVVSLTLSNTATGAPDGYQYSYTTNAGTLSGSTLTMPDQDVTVSVNTAILTAIPWSGDGTEGSPYIIKYASQLDLLAYRVNGTHGETANSYYNKFFQLAKDIKYTPTTDWNDFDSHESNFEAIGGYYNGERSFRGHFDGNKKTISGIRIYKNGDGYDDYYQGIFGLTSSGADIHDLTLADARITGFERTGGIVGYNEGGTVSGCHVAADVAVCAVQSVAYYHGGIAGYNGGTIEQCTSAVTLTTADADNSYCYGGIAGDNYYGTLRDNLAIGATVPATARSSYGAITGDTYGGTLQSNYYAACKVADVENATGVGCGYISDGNGGRIVADVNNDNNPNGAVSIHTLTLADGITTSTPVTVTIGTTGYYAQGTAIALSYSGTTGNIPEGYQYEDGDGFIASAGTINGSTLTMPAADVTVSVLRSTGEAVEVSYVDAGGTPQTAQAIALDGTETDLGSNGKETWYFVGTDIAFGHTLNLHGNVHLILADGKTMTVSGGNKGINADGSLTIYGQTDDTGTLNATSDNGIYTSSGNLTISGGTVTATGDNNGIYTNSGDLTISGGTVTATGGDNGIFIYSGTITISGGRVTATGDNGFGIFTYSSTITLGCTTASDFIYVSSYSVGPEGSLNIADGQTLFDEYGNPYSGTIIDYADLNGKTLRPGLTARQAPDGNYWTTYYNSATGFTIDDDEHACAYTATYGAGQLTLHKLGKEIPAGTAVIIVADNDVVSMTAATDLDAYTDANDLHGVDVDTDVADITSALGEGTIYVLGMTTAANNEQHFGFHRYTGSEMAAHKAFVHVAGSPESPARSLTMVFDEASGIESAEADSSLFTLHSSLSSWFTLDGRRLQAKPTAPGIYVNNGRKVVIK